MATRHVYLAGPILACNQGEANDWRKDAARFLQRASPGIVGISPLRCEPLVGERYGIHEEDKKFGSSRAIKAKNFFDVKNCDLTLAYLPTPPPGRHQSFGTIIEIAWAHALGKPVILVSDDPEVINHPVINASCDWVLPTLEDGLDVCVGILDGYVGGKNV